MSDFAETVRGRIRAEMLKRRLSQRDLAGLLDWSQSRVAKILTGRVEMGLTELEGLCFAVGLSRVEAVRDPGMEFCADLTPAELRTLEQMRKLTREEHEAFATFLNMKLHSRADVRRATQPRKPRLARG